MALDKTSSLTSTSSFGGGYALPQLRQTFNNSQNWTVPEGVRSIFFVLSAGGAGGGAGGNAGNPGGGGGAGGVIFRAVNTTPGATIGITLGAGGNGGSANAGAGNSGGASSISVGNLTYSMSGPTAGGVSSVQNPGNTQISTIINTNAGAGSLASTSPVQTNFKFELAMMGEGYYYQGNGVTNTSVNINTIYDGGSAFNGGSSGGSSSGPDATDLAWGTMYPHRGAGTNFVSSTFSTSFGISGNGGRGVEYGNYNGRTTASGHRYGGSGLTGGGGASTSLGGTMSGAGGGGMGGAGGSATTVTSNRGGGGGGGLTGAGNTPNTSSGGNGGTGGGAGGGGVQNGNGGAGGAGACLIYY